MQERPQKTYPKSPALRERDERLDALKAALGRVAHDFNNFLVPLLGYVALLREEIPADSTAASYASTLETAAKKPEKYLDYLLMTMRPYRRFTPQAFDFAAALRESVAAWQASLPVDAQIRVELTAPSSADLVGDENQWRAAFQQLLNNARHALAMGGVLEITLSSADIPPEEASDLGIAPGLAHRFVFRDNGSGMTPEVLRRCCEPFFSSKSGHPRGLGLTLAHSVAQQHGGQIVVESAEDQGATITITVPPEQAVATAARPGSSREVKTGSPGKILLVEDDPLIREVIKSCLQRTRREILVGVDGVEGLKLFNRHGSDVSLIVTDVTMPKMNGLELYQAVREKDAGVKVIFVSGEADGPIDSLRERGLNGALILRKPFTLKAFSEVIQAYLQ